MALKRALRLRKKSDFQRVRQHGRSIASRLLVLVCAPNGLASIRVGFVVSKRITKRAVERNYLKRLLTEAIRPYLVDIPAGWDIILNAKHSAIGVPLPALVQDVRILLRRARLLDFVTVRESQG